MSSSLGSNFSEHKIVRAISLVACNLVNFILHFGAKDEPFVRVLLKMCELLLNICNLIYLCPRKTKDYVV